MQNRLENTKVQCPYCWQTISILCDCSVEFQSYIEDCQVCCRPIVFDVQVDESEQLHVTVRSEDD